MIINILPQNLYSFIWHFLKPYKTAVIVFVVLSSLCGCWAPFNGMIIKYIVNVISSSQVQEVSQLSWPVALLVINFIIFDNVTCRGIRYIVYKYQPTIKNQIISKSFNYVLGSSHQFFQDNLSGSIASQIATLADNIERILYPIAANFFRGSFLLVVAFIATYYVNPKFFYTLSIWFLLFALVSIYLSKNIVNLSDKHAEAESIISGQLVDSIANASNIRIFAKRGFESSRMEKFLLDSKLAFRTKEAWLLILNIVQGAMIAAMTGIMGYFLVSLYFLKEVTSGDFVLILGICMEVGYITWFTMSQLDEFNQSVGKCKQSLASLIIPPTIKDKTDASVLSATIGEINFVDVKFHYKGRNSLFQNKSVIIRGGQKVGLVGYSGSGKTTFVNLILRLYDVTDGKILIDNQDIRDITQDSLHANISMIPQDPSLFHRTLMENIRYGKAEASDLEVIEASKAAHAHEFITQLPLGYESLVGERGVKLSGGQRQRIAIARAFLKNAPILILDEATSQLDSVTEKLIQDSLWELMKEKTTIVIAHRLSTLLHMDRIMVFEQGKIIADGPNNELLSKDGLYKTFQIMNNVEKEE